MKFDKDSVEILSKHITVAHHTKGRVRFKIDAKILNHKDKIDLDALGKLEQKIKGVKSVSLNKLAKSLTVEYDYALIKESLWEELANGADHEESANKLNNLLKED